MDTNLFWRKARLRRRMTITLALSWPLYGLLMMFALRAVFGSIRVWQLLVIFASWWVIAWLWDRWVDQLTCPRCGKVPFGRNSFWVWRLRCQHCGLNETDDWQPPGEP